MIRKILLIISFSMRERVEWDEVCMLTVEKGVGGVKLDDFHPSPTDSRRLDVQLFAAKRKHLHFECYSSKVKFSRLPSQFQAQLS